MKKIKILILILLLSGIIKAQLREQNSIKKDNKETSRVATKSTTELGVLSSFQDSDLDWGDANNLTTIGNSFVGNTHKLNNLANGEYDWSVQAIDNENKAGAWSSEKVFTIETASSTTQDSLALVALYNASNGANWTNNTNWLTGTIDTWYGVTVDSGRVTKLSLFSNNLNGQIPVEIGNLTNLNNLNIQMNQLSGSLPKELGNLTSLQYLYLNDNQLIDSIPKEIGNINTLIEFTLNTNQLTGSIPAELGTLGNLKNLDLEHNQLTGTIPWQLGNLSNLTQLFLDYNKLTGTIPYQLGNLTSLQYLYLRNNLLNGSIPIELGNINTLRELDLSNNELTGSIPTELETLSNLYQINLSYNQFTGTIPIELGNLTNLIILELSNNQLSDSVPTQLGQLTSLSNCNLYGNGLSEIPVFNSTVLDSTAFAGLRVGDNNLSFYYLALNKANLQTEDKYAPQNDIPLLKSDTVPQLNTAFTINMNELSGKTLSEANNSYLWYKNGNSTGITTENYVFSNYTLADTGTYYLEMTNSQFPNLTIKTQSIHVISIPNAPVNLSATVVSSSQIDLSWTDNSTDEDGFYVYYSTDSLNFSSKDSVNANITSYSANSLSAPTSYYFKVCSYNSAGENCSNIISATTPTVSSSDSLALVALYNATDGANWKNNTNWLTGNVNTWYGVTVDSGRVTRLNLVGNNLNGQIPIEIGNLSELKYIHLETNNLPNPLPSQIGNLLKLDTLNIANSQLTGAIPASIGSLTNLVVLELNFNQLNDTIPAELGNLTNLSSLGLHHNQLSGAIPAELGNLANLTTLDFYYNKLSGSIPVEFGNLTNLTTLDLGNNQLSGSIPVEFGNLTNLTTLELSNNQLSGSIPVEFGNLTNLTTLDLGNNQLSGAIPAEFGSLTNLTTLSLYHNQLSGNIPTEFGNLANLSYLNLGSNQLSGSIPVEFGNLANLRYIDLSSNQLSGFIPIELGNLTNITDLLLGNNKFNQLTDLSALKLRNITLENNYFSFADLSTTKIIWDSLNYYIYTPQYDLPLLKSDTVPQLNTAFTINMNELCSKTISEASNSYLWYKNGISTGVTTETYLINNFTLADTGYYYLEMTNSKYIGLIINTQSIHLSNQNNVSLPNSPSNLSANVISSSQIDLVWSDNSNNEDGFYVYYSSDNINFTKITTTIANITSYSAGSLNSNTTYYFKVCAYNSAGETCSNLVSAITTPSATPLPTAPTLNSVNAISGTQIEVNWTDNSNNEDGFYVYYSTDSTNFTYYETANPNTNTLTINQLTKSTKYYFKVCAHNSNGESCSNIMSATTPDSNSPSVADLAHCQGETNQAFVADGINIKWYDDAGLSNLIATGSSYTSTETNADVYTYYVTQTIENVESDPAIAKLTIYALPYANAGSDSSLCEKTINLNANSPTAYETGKWTTDGYGSFSSQNNSSTTFYSTYSGILNLIWQVSNNNTGCSNSDNVMVTIFDKPEIPQIKQKGQNIPNFALFICQTPDMKYQWYKNNNAISGANGQYYIERSNFGNNYSVSITDENGCSISNNVNYVKTGKIKIKIYPVPAKNNTKMTLTCENKGNFNLRITSPSGVLYQNRILNKTHVEQEYNLNINSLKSGIYIIEVIFNNEIKITDKLIIQ